jgi:peroxiredoxin
MKLLWCVALATLAIAADPKAVSVNLSSAKERTAAPLFVLQDAAGKTVRLKKLRGKVVLLDFWATWCHGCKEEIPWFAEFHRKYAAQGLVVIGASMDEEGWKIVRPFLGKTDVPYCIVLGNEPLAKNYRIETMPDTFLIDRHGRLAAAYAGMVDKDNVESNIHVLLSQK